MNNKAINQSEFSDQMKVTSCLKCFKIGPFLKLTLIKGLYSKSFYIKLSTLSISIIW